MCSASNQHLWWHSWLYSLTIFLSSDEPPSFVPRRNQTYIFIGRNAIQSVFFNAAMSSAEACPLDDIIVSISIDAFYGRTTTTTMKVDQLASVTSLRFSSNNFHLNSIVFTLLISKAETISMKPFICWFGHFGQTAGTYRPSTCYSISQYSTPLLLARFFLTFDFTSHVVWCVQSTGASRTDVLDPIDRLIYPHRFHNITLLYFYFDNVYESILTHSFLDLVGMWFGVITKIVLTPSFSYVGWTYFI